MRILSITVLGGLLGVFACGSNSSDGSGPSSSGGNASGGFGSDAAGSGSLLVGPTAGDAGAAGAAPDKCGGTTLDAAPKKVNVLLVVDKSSSMSATPSGFGDTKWNGIRAALGAAIDATQGQVAFGLDFFPNSGSPKTPLSNVCELPKTGAPSVAVARGEATNAAIKQALADNAPAGATPTAAALMRALSYFTSGVGASLEGEHYVLLATDGGPNCNTALTCAAASCTLNMDGSCPKGTNCCDAKLDPDGPSKCLDDGATLSAVEALGKAKVKTFVVGIPGTEAYGPTLDSVALAGGEPNPDAPPNYFAITATGGVEALSQVLTNITTGLITSCDLVLSKDPPDHEQINVVIDGQIIPEGSTNGWRLDTSSLPPTIHLLGTTCDAVRTTGAQQLSVTFGCPTEHVK